jgi:adenylate cyclase class IV
MQNIEYKAELRNIEAARAQCAALGAERLGTLRQTDTYFKLTDGRLKRREAPGEPTVWVYYHRPDRAGARMSNYTLLSEEQARRRWGTASLPEWLAVVKTRELWMLGQVRIHLDEVDDLGTFIEFEGMVSREFDVQACHAAVARLRETFEPVMGESIAVSYCDLAEVGSA